MKSIGLLVIWAVLSNIKAYKILGVYPVPSKSHFYVGNALMEGLARDGHEVTVISPFKPANPPKNYEHIFLELSYELFVKDTAKNNFMEFNSLYFWEMTLSWFDTGLLFTNWTISSKNFRQFVKIKRHFDVVIVESVLQDALFGFSQHFKAPLIATSAFGASKWTTDLVGAPTFASYIPHVHNHYSDHMTFWQRMYNSLIFWFEDIAMPIYFTPKQQTLMQHTFPDTENWPSLEDIKRNVSLVLLNTHITYGTVRPYTSNMIEVGGMQIQENVTPLPSTIQTFLDDAKDGAIYFSLGSNVLLTKLPDHQKDAILNAFVDYPNIRILVKSDEDILIPSHNKSDVLVQPWFDQQSILAHKNVKLFVTHGGLLSTTEAIYFAKPVLGIPFFFDQHLNMQIAQQKGHGINVPIETLTTENVKSAVNELLNNLSYAEKVKLSSDRYRDQLKSPLEIAMHWVKYVAKHKGAPHLKSVAVDLPFYVLYNLDVWAFIASIIVSIILMMKYLIHKTISIFSPNIRIKAKRS